MKTRKGASKLERYQNAEYTLWLFITSSTTLFRGPVYGKPIQIATITPEQYKKAMDKVCYISAEVAYLTRQLEGVI